MRRLLLPSLVAVVAASACIPSRDNPNDPSRRPDAGLFIANCAGTQVTTVSRGDCLALNASGSTNPLGPPSQIQYTWLACTAATGCTSTTSAPPLLAPHPVDESVLPNLLDSSASVQVLSPAFLRRVPTNVPLVFEVVEKGPGGIDTASASVTLTNARPVAATDAPRVFPLGGFPWAPGQPVNVTFSGINSSDPDGDPLLYCWSFSDNFVVSPAQYPQAISVPNHGYCFPSSAPTLTRAVSTTALGVLTGQLQVFDAQLFSSIQPAVVRIGDAAIWTADASASAAALTSLDTEHGQPDLTPLTGTEVLIHGTNGNYVVNVEFSGVFGDKTPVQVETWPPPVAQALTSTAQIEYPIGVIHTQLNTTNIWIFASQKGTTANADDNFMLQQWNVVPGAVPAPVAPPVPFLFQVPHYCATYKDCSQLFTVDGATNFYMTVSDTTEMVFSAGGSSVTPVFSTSTSLQNTFVVRDTALRPAPLGTNGVAQETWIVEEAESGTPASGSPARIAVYDPAVPEAPSYVFPIPLSPVARNIIFAGTDEFWLFIPFQGLFLMDAGLLEDGVGFAQSIIVTIPFQDDVASAFPSADNVLWLTTEDQEQFYALKDGTLIDVGPGVVVRGQDSVGALLFEPTSGATFGQRGFNPTSSGLRALVPRQGTTFGALAGDGGVYAYIPSLNEMLRYASDGELTATIASVAVPSPSPFPVSIPITVSPDGRWLWTLETDPANALGTAINRYDLSTTPPLQTAPPAGLASLGSATLAQQVQNWGYMLVPSAPASGEDFLWLLSGTQTAPVLGILTTGSGFSSVFATFAAGEMPGTFPVGLAPFANTMTLRRPWAADRSRVTNNLCFADFQSNGTTLNIRWVTPAGTEQLLSLNSGTQNVLGGVSVGQSSSGADACWVAIVPAATAMPACPGETDSATNPQATTTIFEVNSNATLVASQTGVGGYTNGVISPGPNQLWVSTYRCSPNLDDERVLLDFTDLIGNAVVSTAIDLTPGGSRGFLLP